MTTLLIITALAAIVVSVAVYMWRHRGDMVGHRPHIWERRDHHHHPYPDSAETEQRLGVWLFETGGFE